MSLFLRSGILAASLMCTTGFAAGSTPKEIAEAIKKGTDALRSMSYKGQEIGPTALSGIAMLEGGVPVTDPTLKAVTEQVRNASYKQFKTYETSLCLMYLDRLGDPVDDALVQILAVRLLAGQTTHGGWNYDCLVQPNQIEEQELRSIKPVNDAGQPKLHPKVEEYYRKLTAARNAQMLSRDDNSNTQFAVIAVWLSRKHGVPVDSALELVERRYLESQGSNGCWAYPGPPEGKSDAMMGSASPAMFCAGLIGISTAIARREERRAKAHAPKKEEAPKKDQGDSPKPPDDPFFLPPPPPKAKQEAKKPTYAPDDKDIAAEKAFAGLGQVIAASVQAGRGALLLKTERHGLHDLYFYWSLERACVIYGIEKLGGTDWYEAGAHTLVKAQGAAGTWGGGSYGIEVNTSFAVLFLCRSNLARDLAGAVQKDGKTEMRNAPGPGNNSASSPPKKNPLNGGNPNAVPAISEVPLGVQSEAATLAFQLIKSGDEKIWTTNLTKLRETKGDNCTEALVTAANRLDGDRLKQARQALADRLTRMSPETLRAMAKSEEPELRRGALLGMAQKDDKKYIPDLVEALLDEEEIVVRASKAGLKSLAGQDFGPANNANIGEKKLAIDAWRSWLEKQKK